MSYDYFPEEGSRYTPSYGLSRKVNANVVVNQYGDGYEQRIPAGKNYITDELSVSWNNINWNYSNDPSKDEDGNIIYNFLLERLKRVPFYFKESPTSAYKLYFCEDLGYSASQFHLVNITATFKEYKGL